MFYIQVTGPWEFWFECKTFCLEESGWHSALSLVDVPSRLHFGTCFSLWGCVQRPSLNELNFLGDIFL